ncbi:hypothetical protein BGW80DRAFT_384009 [Lactifluus volemus]|nr:hypothetical protein BGW80DRAFT_384009 [Lactifluus volemus]
MSDEHEEYITILKSSYDYAPQSEDEIEIKEDQLLLLVAATSPRRKPMTIGGKLNQWVFRTFSVASLHLRTLIR